MVSTLQRRNCKERVWAGVWVKLECGLGYVSRCKSLHDRAPQKRVSYILLLTERFAGMAVTEKVTLGLFVASGF